MLLPARQYYLHRAFAGDTRTSSGERVQPDYA
jgi:hypothetical protein